MAITSTSDIEKLALARDVLREQVGAHIAARGEQMREGASPRAGGGAAKAGPSDEEVLVGPREAGPRAGAGGEKPQVHFRKSLRNPNINYRSGWWAVSIQVAKNKSIFGAIVGVKAVLNALGAAVEAYGDRCP